MKDLIDLHEALKVAGFTITGLAGEPPDVKITGWETEPSKEVASQAEDFIRTFDWNKPVKTEEELKQEVAALTQEQRMKLVDRLIIELGLANPEKFEEAKRVTLGVK